MVATWIALLRAIGPASHEKMSMAQLRDGCALAGLQNPRTYIASGNLIATSDWPADRVRETIEGIVAAHGLHIGRSQPINNAVILRAAHRTFRRYSRTPSSQMRHATAPRICSLFSLTACRIHTR